MAGFSQVDGWEGFATTVGEVYDDLGARIDPSPVRPKGSKPGWPEANFLLWASTSGVLVLGVATAELPVRPYPPNAPRLPVSAEAPYSTVLHLAAHALCGGLEVTRHGDYHNSLFRRAVDLLGDGYSVTYHRTVGWGVANLTEAHYSTIGHLLLSTAYAESWDRAPIEQKLPRKNGLIRLVCNCGRVVYSRPRTAERGRLFCGLCNTTFKEPLGPGLVRPGGEIRLPPGPKRRT